MRVKFTLCKPKLLIVIFHRRDAEFSQSFAEKIRILGETLRDSLRLGGEILHSFDN